jgi:hypothetical protein
MRIHLLIVALAALALLAVSGCEDLEQEVRDSYSEYTAAVDAKDLSAVLSLTDPTYIEHLDFLVKMARSGEKDRVMKLTPVEKVHIVRMRNRLKREELAAMTGKEWLSRRLKEGWTKEVDEDGPEIGLGDITVKRPRAFAVLTVNGMDTDFKMQFAKTNNQWVLDPKCWEDLVNNFIRRIPMSEGAENTMILRAEASASGKRVTEAIWEKPK